MEDLFIKGDAKSPTFECFSSTGKIKIYGVSIPEDTLEVFKPFKDWFAAYSASPAASTVITVALQYFNTSTSRLLYDYFNKASELQKAGNTNVSLHWVYERDDEDMEEAGEHYQAILDIPLNLVPIDDLSNL